MPSATSTLSCIGDSLKKSLTDTSGKRKNVSATVSSSAKKALLEKAEIKFVKAENGANTMLDNLKNKYTCLNKGASLVRMSGWWIRISTRSSGSSSQVSCCVRTLRYLMP